jgi:preprotein translocase subunit SecE
MLGKLITIRPILFPCIVIFLVGAWLVFLYLNKPKVADFLIETEGELKKVSWPQRKEFLGASLAVLIIILFIVFYLYLIDMGLSMLLRRIGLGY